MGQIAQIIGGGTPPTSDPRNFDNGDIPWVTPADLTGYTAKHITGGARSLTALGLTGSGARLLPTGTVLFSSRAPIGYVAIAGAPLCTNQGFKSFVLGAGIAPDYVYYFLKSAKDLATSLASGTTFLEISGAKAALIPVPLAPLPEQRRIVAEIERQFSLLDAGVASLQRVQASLKRYRAAVLQAACTGRLVPTEAEMARAEGRPYEPADVLLARILAERRARWEAEQSAKMEAQGRLPLGGAWKGKYVEPAAPDTKGLPELPEGWGWASLSMMTSNIGDVDHKMPKAVAEGVPYVSTKDFQGENDIDFERAKRISLEDYSALCRKIKPRFGDLLLSRYGTVGEVRQVRTERPFQASYSVAILKMITGQVTTEYVMVLMRSSIVQTQIKRDIRASAQPDLGLDYIRKFTLPLPPLAEQARIVAEVERRLSVVDNLEQVVKANLTRAERLRQAVLKEAFAGRLVPQDPADEPAGDLLERIQAARAAQAGTPAKAAQGASGRKAPGRKAPGRKQGVLTL